MHACVLCERACLSMCQCVCGGGGGGGGGEGVEGRCFAVFDFECIFVCSFFSTSRLQMMLRSFNSHKKSFKKIHLLIG